MRGGQDSGQEIDLASTSTQLVHRCQWQPSIGPQNDLPLSPRAVLLNFGMLSPCFFLQGCVKPLEEGIASRGGHQAKPLEEGVKPLEEGRERKGFTYRGNRDRVEFEDTCVLCLPPRNIIPEK